MTKKRNNGLNDQVVLQSFTVDVVGEGNGREGVGANLNNSDSYSSIPKAASDAPSLILQ